MAPLLSFNFLDPDVDHRKETYVVEESKQHMTFREIPNPKKKAQHVSKQQKTIEAPIVFEGWFELRGLLR